MAARSPIRSTPRRPRPRRRRPRPRLRRALRLPRERPIPLRRRRAPLAIGGAVTSGIYHLVDLTLYTGPGGNAGPLPLSIKQTIAINGATAQVITEVSGKSQDASSTFVTSGTSVSLAPTCPTPGKAATATFSATPTSLTMFLVNDGGDTVSYTYEP